MAEPVRDVLVALIPTPADLAIAHEQGWYRVRSEEQLGRLKGELNQFTHLGFYQPASFGKEKWCLRRFAPILRTSSERRIERQ